MISVIIPTLNVAATLPAALASLGEARGSDLVSEVIVADGGSADATRTAAEAGGARFIACDKGRGVQLAAGAAAARGRWLLFLHADTLLAPGWAKEAAAFIAADERRAGVFSLKFDEEGTAPALVAAGAMFRTRMFTSPYGDQGLLISRAAYDAVGGYRPLLLFEDVDIIDRFVRAYGRTALVVLKATAITSALRYRRGGYVSRVAKNSVCFMLYRLGMSPTRIAKFYE